MRFLSMMIKCEKSFKACLRQILTSLNSFIKQCVNEIFQLDLVL